MKTMVGTLTATLGIVAVGAVLAPRANAQCGVSEGAKASAALSAWQEQAQLRPTSLAPDQEGEHDGDSSDDTIVGFWKVTFVAKGNPDIPDGTVIDSGYAQWHSDGTEITNSSKPPATSNFCLGVWKKIGRAHFKLNHFGLSSDLNGTLIGPANIREDVTVSHHGTSYAGTFTIDQFDLAGNVIAHVAGLMKATRITVDTPPTS